MCTTVCKQRILNQRKRKRKKKRIFCPKCWIYEIHASTSCLSLIPSLSLSKTDIKPHSVQRHRRTFPFSHREEGWQSACISYTGLVDSKVNGTIHVHTGGTGAGTGTGTGLTGCAGGTTTGAPIWNGLVMSNTWQMDRNRHRSWLWMGRRDHYRRIMWRGMSMWRRRIPMRRGTSEQIQQGNTVEVVDDQDALKKKWILYGFSIELAPNTETLRTS